jgi:5'-nucleotidase
MEKKIVYVDMDNVLVDFKSGIERIDKDTFKKFEDRLDEVPGIFSLMTPMEDAIESYVKLCDHFDTYILSTSPWENPTALNDKLDWVKKHLGNHAYKRLILSHHKHLNHGHYLIDDREKNGADRFKGELILFGSDKFPSWNIVMDYLLTK